MGQCADGRSLWRREAKGNGVMLMVFYFKYEVYAWIKYLVWLFLAEVWRNYQWFTPIRQISWTHALRQIVINCYKFHGREDLLPAFSEDEEEKSPTANMSVLKFHTSQKPSSHSQPPSPLQAQQVKYKLPRDIVNFRISPSLHYFWAIDVHPSCLFFFLLLGSNTVRADSLTNDNKSWRIGFYNTSWSQ